MVRAFARRNARWPGPAWACCVIRDDRIHAQLAADWDHADPDSARQHPPTPLPGYQLVEITIAGDSPASSRKLGEVPWPPASTPVSILRGRHLRPPDPQLTLAPGDRVGLLTVTPGHSAVPDPAEPDDIRPAGNGTGSRP